MQNKNLPRDVFLYLLSIATLTATAVSLGIILFQFINIYIPDVISDPYMTKSFYLGSIRSSLAFLIVVFPVYLWTVRFLKKDMKANPEKRDLKIRKWLLYLTLFVAAVVMIGDLVGIIYSFLQGELTTRFILKAVTIVVIAGSVFFYYFHELREKISSGAFVRIFSWAVTGFIAAAVVAGFIVAGSPQNQRLVRLDQTRINDLQTIQNLVLNYWQAKETVPASLADLRNDINSMQAPLQDQAGLSYDYKKKDKLSFQICATFDTSNKDQVGPNSEGSLVAPVYDRGYGLDTNWLHDKGYICFDRKIDPDFNPTLKQKI